MFRPDPNPTIFWNPDPTSFQKLVMAKTPGSGFATLSVSNLFRGKELPQMMKLVEFAGPREGSRKPLNFSIYFFLFLRKTAKFLFLARWRANWDHRIRPKVRTSIWDPLGSERMRDEEGPLHAPHRIRPKMRTSIWDPLGSERVYVLHPAYRHLDLEFGHI